MDTATIIEHCAAGDRDAMSSLYRAYSPRMLRLILRYVNDPAAAEDILHDGFIIILSHISEVRNPERLEYWMGTIMKNLAIQYLSRIEIATILEKEDEPIDTPDLNDILSYEELEIIINKLPEGYRTIFKLAVFENKSHKEIGRMLGIAPHSSSSQLARAKAMLRKLIAERQATLGIGILLIAATIPLFFTERLTESMPIAMAVNESILMETKTEIKSDGESKNVKAISDSTNFYAYNVTAIKPQTTRRITPVNVVIDTTGQDNVQIESNTESTTGYHEDEVNDGETDISPAEPSDNDIINANNPDDGNVVVAVTDHVNEVVEPATITTKSSRRWSIGVNYDVRSLRPDNNGNHDGLSSSSPSDDMTDNGENKPNTPPEDAKSGSVDSQTTETRHSMPITLGVTLNHQLNRCIGIETGLNFTYARSEVIEQTNDRITSERDIKTYYIGIPLKLNFRIATYYPISFYGSCGVGLDIPIYHYDRVDYGREVYSEPSIQFSVSGGLGLEYRLSPTVSIYAEPSVKYYPGNGSSYSNFRSEHPWDISIPVGFRFNL